MKTFNFVSAAIVYSIDNPSELVECVTKNMLCDTTSYCFFLNGLRHGRFKYCNADGIVLCTEYYISGKFHGECRTMINSCMQHGFYVEHERLHELDYLLNEPRDEAFYVTLAMHGIFKEHTIQ